MSTTTPPLAEAIPDTRDDASREGVVSCVCERAAGHRRMFRVAKYGRQARSIERRESKEQHEEFMEQTLWRPDPDRLREESSESHYVTKSGLIAQRVVRYLDTHEIIEFAVTYSETEKSGQNREVLCIDTCHHGSIHRHVDGDHASEPDVIAVITSQDVVQHGYADALEEAYDAVDWEAQGENGS